MGKTTSSPISLVETLALSSQVVDDLEYPVDAVSFPEISNRDMVRAQRNDEGIGLIISWLIKKTKPNKNQISHNRETNILLREFPRLFLEKGILHRSVQIRNEKYQQIVLPKQFRAMALQGCHEEAGHLGKERTLDLLRERFYWPKMSQDVESNLKNCERCLCRKSPTNNRAPLVNIKTTQPLEIVCLDYLTLEMSKDGYQSILVITDHYTRYCIAVPTKNMTAQTTADALFNNFIVHYGFPKRLHSDQGAQFEGKIIQALCSLTGMQKSHTTVYHPISNESCERFNRTLLNMLGTLDPAQKVNWKVQVSPLVHACNCTRHESTSYAPYYLMFGRTPRLPIDLVFGIKKGNQAKSYPSYVES